MTFQDHLNRTLTLDGQPQRIISLVPSLTELLHDLGLEKREFTTVFVTDIKNFQEALDFINEIGMILGKRVSAQWLVDKITLKYNAFTAQLKDKRPVKAAYFIWKKPWMVAGNDTFINSMMSLNRLENVFAGKGRYPEINIQHLKLQGHPELLLFSSEPYHFTEEDAFEVLRSNEKILSIFVDGQYFSWYGSRLLKAFDYFKTFQDRLTTYE